MNDDTLADVTTAARRAHKKNNKEFFFRSAAAIPAKNLRCLMIAEHLVSWQLIAVRRSLGRVLDVAVVFVPWRCG